MFKKSVFTLLILCTVVSFLSADESLDFEDVVIYTINNNSSIQLKRYALAMAKGQFRSSRNPSDVVVGGSVGFSRTVDPVDPDDTETADLGAAYLADIILDGTETESVNTSLWAQKQFAFGMSLKLAVDLYNSDLYNQLSGADSGLAPDSLSDPESRNYSNQELTLSLPILKSFNNSLLQKNIDLARFNMEVQQIELINLISLTILKVSDAYWQYAATHKQYLGVQRSILRLEEQLVSLDKLVSAGQRLSSDLSWMKANLASTRTDAISLENQLKSDKAELVKAMGIPREEIDAIGFPTSEFPEVPPLDGEEELITPETIDGMIKINSELQSLRKQLVMTQTQLEMARVSARPDLDFNFSFGYKGTTYGSETSDYFAAPGENIRGSNFSAGLIFSMPLPNSKKGDVEAAEAQYQQKLLELEDSIREVVINIKQAGDNVSGYRQSLENAFEVLQLHEGLLESSRKQFDAGLITVNELYDLEEKIQSSETAYYHYYKSYLSAVGLLKYYTGALVELYENKESYFLERQLYDLP